MAGDNWTEVSLAEIMEVKHGFAFPGESIRDKPPGDILLTPGNFAIGGGFKGDKFKYFDGAVPEDYVLLEDDLIVTMTDLSKEADTLGYPALVPKPNKFRFLHNQRLGKVLIQKATQVDKHFLFYLLRTPGYRHEVLASATGTTVKHTSPNRILAHKTYIPTFTEQKFIADILGTLDDKIELNRQTHETLEQLSQAIFKSWFLDATANDIPENWQVVALEQLASIQGGKQLPTEECQPEGAHTVFGANGIMGYAERATHNGFVIAFGRVGAYCGSIHWAYRGAWINNNASAVVPHRWPEFVLQAMLNIDFAAMRTGSAQPFIPNSALAAAPVVRPPDKLLDSYCSVVRPLRLKQTTLEEESRTLAALRDVLLPKLLSGEVRVRQTE